MNLRKFVISAGRPMNVPKMHALAGDNVMWVVPPGQEGEYRTAGANKVHTVEGLCEARNSALELAARDEAMCLQLSDDLRGLAYYDGDHRHPLDMDGAIRKMRDAMVEHNALLCGVAPTTNTFFYNKPVSTRNFVVGDMVLIDPRCHLWFDVHLPLKEDYDYTLQHLTKYGIALRINGVMATFSHRTNRGGAVDYRTEQLEQQAISRLKECWPDNIIDNAKRPNEVLMRWKP